MFKWQLKPYLLITLTFLSVFILIQYIPIVLVHADTNKKLSSVHPTGTNTTTTKESKNITGIMVNVDNNLYTTGSFINIHGKVFDDADAKDLSHIPIIIKVEKIKSATLGNPQFGWNSKLNTSELVTILPTETRKDGIYNATTMVQDGGMYRVTAEITNNQNNHQQQIQTPFRIFEAAPMLVTFPFILLYTAIALFIALLTTIATSAPKKSDTDGKGVSRDYITNILYFKRDTAKREILRFAFISGILACIIGSLIFSDVQVGANSPVGLVRQHVSANQTSNEWIINVGGIQNPSTLNYVGGIQIPSTVVIFGLLGGYLRYLYGLRYVYTAKDSSQNSKDADPLWGDIDLNDPLWFFKHALRRLSLIFLAPLLAVGIWFIIFQGNFEGKFAISAISLAIGLITEEAVQSIISFSRNMLSGLKGVQPETEKKKSLKVIAKSPTSDGLPVKVSSPQIIAATFNNVINMKTVDHLSFYIKDINRNDPNEINQNTKTKYELSDDAKTVKCTIVEGTLKESTTYIVTITTEVKGINGYYLDAPEIWSFMTERASNESKIDISQK